MIESHEIPDGILLSVEPFTKSNKNAACKIIAEINWTHETRRVVRFRVCQLRHMMTLGDMAVLMNAMRALTDEVNRRMVKVPSQAVKPGRKMRRTRG